MASSLRSFRAEDATAVVELSRRAVNRPEEQVGNPLWTALDELESELDGWDGDPGTTLLVEEEEGGVIGFGGVERAEGWEHADLFGPLVSPRSRGRKIGGRLLEASVELARSGGASRVVGSVGTRNVAGRVLLSRSGFDPLGSAEAVLRVREDGHRAPPEPREPIAVRAAESEDLSTALALYRESFPGGAFPEAAWRRALERGSVYLAERGAEALAFVHIDPSDRWIYHLGVTESDRARGVGASLLAAALEHYWRVHPRETLGLAVPADNLAALRLFRRQGFLPWLTLQTFELAL